MANVNNKNNPLLLKFNYLMMEYFETKDVQYAEKALLMFKSEQLKAIPHKDGKWLFIPKSAFKSKCKACQAEYQKGDSIFCQNQIGYHPVCAPDEAKSPTNDCFSLYQKWLASMEPKSEKIGSKSREALLGASLKNNICEIKNAKIENNNKPAWELATEYKAEQDKAEQMNTTEQNEEDDGLLHI